MPTLRIKTGPIAAIVVIAFAGSAVPAETPRIHTHEKFCRGAPYRGGVVSIPPKTRDYAPAVRSPPQSSCNGRTAISAQCRRGDFTDLEGAPVESGAGQDTAGIIPAKYFHLIWENRR